MNKQQLRNFGVEGSTPHVTLFYHNASKPNYHSITLLFSSTPRSSSVTIAEVGVSGLLRVDIILGLVAIRIKDFFAMTLPRFEQMYLKVFLFLEV